MQVLGAKVDDIGRIIFSPEPDARKIFFEAVYETPVGQEFLKHRNPKSISRLAGVLEEKFLNRGRDILVEDAVAVIRDLLTTMDPAVIPPPFTPPPTAAETRERNPDGTFKSEFQVFSEQHSSFDCSERAKIEADYASWRHLQYRVDGLQQGEFTIAGLPERAAMADEREQYADFVNAYNAAPSQNIRPRGGHVVLDENHKYTAQEFQQLVTRAARLGLI
jgi:hypothetical protein